MVAALLILGLKSAKSKINQPIISLLIGKKENDWSSQKRNKSKSPKQLSIEKSNKNS